jgi:hypothetical protein
LLAGGRAHDHRANPLERRWRDVRRARMHAPAIEAARPAATAAPGGGAAP